MSTLRTYNLQNPDSSNVNIELTQGSGAVVAGVATFSSNVTVSGNLTVGGELTYEDVTNVDSVGLITARSGISITGGDLTIPDAIIHDSDTNTRIRFPASDTFTVETAGNERLRITSAGSVGVGTDNPDSKLVVSNGGTSSSASGGTLARIVGSGVARLDIVAGNSNHSILEFSRANLTAAGQITYTHSDNSLSFTANGAQEKLRITSEGSALLTTNGQSAQYSYAMKLGQSSYNPNDATGPHYGLWVRQLGPRYELNYGVYSEIEDDSGFYGGETLDGLTSVRGVGVYGASTTSTQAYQKGIGVYGKAFNTNTNYNTTIGVRGRAEIGTTTFTNNNGQQSFGGHFVATGKADCVGVYADAYLDGSPGANQVAIPLLVSSNGSEKLRITAAGDMGLGTNSPTSFGPTFQVAGTDPALLLQDTATAVDYYGINVQSGSVINWFDDSAYFAIGTASGLSGGAYSEKLRIDNVGRLTITGQGLKLNPNTSSLYALDGSLSYYATNNGVYLNGAGTNGWLRLNASGVENDQNSINIFGSAGARIEMRTSNVERLRITSDGKFGFNTTSPAGQVHIKGNTDESANPSIILDDNGDTRRCYVTNTSGDLMLGGIDSGTVQSRLTIHENGNIYHQRLNSSGQMMYQFATSSSQTSGAASGNTYVEHMAFRGGSEGMKTGSFNMTIYGDGGDNYMPVLFTRHGYHPTNSSFGGQWFGEMWLNNAGSINPQNYNHTGYNNWATCSFKYRWDCAHWNAKPTLNMIEHYINYGRTNIADLEISGTTSYFVMWLLPGIYRVTYSAWDGLNAWWTNNSNVGGALTHREGSGNTTRAVRAYSARDTRYDNNISWGAQGQT